MKIALYGHTFEEENKTHLEEILDQLKDHEVEPLFYAPFYWEVKHSGILKDSYEIFEDTDDLHASECHYMISLGGDGTLLNAAALAAPVNLPIAGLNLGRLGFLASIEKKNINRAIKALLSGNFEVESRTMLHLESDPPIFQDKPFALNDFTLHKRDNSNMILVHTYIDEKFLNSYWADGLVTATPTGSTGYSLSCGGPIVYPGSGNFIITPVAPHNLTIRPLIIDDNSLISYKVEGRSESFLATMDSRNATITKDHKLIVKKSDFKTQLIHIEGYSFMKTLRNKLGWGSDVRN